MRYGYEKENNYAYEKDKLHIDKVLCLIVCPPLIILSPYLIYDDIKNGYKKDALAIFIFILTFLSIIALIISMFYYW